jgi:hypothetical protein
MINKKFIVGVMVIIAILGGGFIAKSVILGNAQPVETRGEDLQDTTSQSLGGSSAKLDPTASLPQAGKDYTIKDQRYFEGKNWVVLYIEPTNQNAADPAYIVMKLADGKYNTVLGPGSYFPQSVVKNLGMPSSVVDYLNEKGLIG